jgi:hypothetical protein
MKKSKVKKESHAPNSPVGSGDYYGQGIRNPMGKIRRDYLGVMAIKPKSVKTPPKSLA